MAGRKPQAKPTSNPKTPKLTPGTPARVTKADADRDAHLTDDEQVEFIVDGTNPIVGLMQKGMKLTVSKETAEKFVRLGYAKRTSGQSGAADDETDTGNDDTAGDKDNESGSDTSGSETPLKGDQ